VQFRRLVGVCLGLALVASVTVVTGAGEPGGVPMILSSGFEEVLGVSCVVAFGLGYVGLLVGEHVE
jgi:hypothetical protein